MKCNYKIYEKYSGDMPEHNTMLDEQIIVARVKQSLEEQKRIVIRPKAKVWKDVFLILSLIVIVSVTMISIRLLTDISNLIFALMLILITIVFFVVLGKNLLLTIITLYQKYAPETVRTSCLFEPCCSEYMRISVIKYGAIMGFIKGIKRILRCRYPNGGVDEP